MCFLICANLIDFMIKWSWSGPGCFKSFELVDLSSVSKFIGNSDHEVANVLEGSWSGVNSGLDESVHWADINNICDSYDLWENNSGFEVNIEECNISVNSCLDFRLEGSSGHSRDGWSEWSSINGTNVGSVEISEQNSVGGLDHSSGFGSVEFSIDCLSSFDRNGNG